MIPRLDVRRLEAEKKYEGELSFSFEGDPELIPIPYVSFASPVLAELRYEILEDDSVHVEGVLRFSLKGMCSRCLKETCREIEFPAEGYFIPPQGKGEAEDYEYSNGIVDLRVFLRDAVLFSMPAGLLCSENCSAPDYRED